jgi:hypothetical protein
MLDLEERVADITNVSLAARDADLADDNISVDGTGNDATNKEKRERGWKKLINKLRQTPARKHSQVRELLVSAIGAARQAHLPQVVAELRSALLLFHPSAANECKRAAVHVLVSNGDFVADDDEEENGEAVDGSDDNQEESGVSVLSAEAATLRSSLGGSDDASREDWVGMVKSTKTVSRLASFLHAFAKDAMERIEKIETERDALTSALAMWSKAEVRQTKQTKGSKKAAAPTTAASKRDLSGPSEVWANVEFTDEICMAKAENYPWWPAKVCLAKDAEVAASLQKVNRSLVALIGEMGSLRVVHTTLDIRPFTGQLIAEDDKGEEAAPVEYTKEMKAQLDECMTMARRIQRGLQRREKAL